MSRQKEALVTWKLLTLEQITNVGHHDVRNLRPY